MPFKSRKQAAYFEANKKQLEAQGVNVKEWEQATDFSRLPERAPRRKQITRNQLAPRKRGAKK